MVNNQFIKDLQKGVVNSPSVNQELPAGSPRRYEPASGIKKHNETIHKESRMADHYKNLPFTFRKPPKPYGRSTYIKCDNCGYITLGTTATVGFICPECKKFSTVTEVEFDK